MARCRLPAAVAICAALLAACAEGGVTVAASSSTTTLTSGEQPTSTTVAPVPTTTRAEPPPITFTLNINDDGVRLRLRPGDEVVPRLPVAGVTGAGWVVLIAPNPAVLTGGDDLLWQPSETNQGRLGFHEFYFIAAGPGQTSVTLTRGWQEFTFTVVVSSYQ